MKTYTNMMSGLLVIVGVLLFPGFEARADASDTNNGAKTTDKIKGHHASGEKLGLKHRVGKASVTHHLVPVTVYHNRETGEKIVKVEHDHTVHFGDNEDVATLGFGRMLAGAIGGQIVHNIGSGIKQGVAGIKQGVRTAKQAAGAASDMFHFFKDKVSDGVYALKDASRTAKRTVSTLKVQAKQNVSNIFGALKGLFSH